MQIVKRFKLTKPPREQRTKTLDKSMLISLTSGDLWLRLICKTFVSEEA